VCASEMRTHAGNNPRRVGVSKRSQCAGQVWEADERAPAERPPGGGESVAEVAARVRALLAGLEAEHAGRTLLLVSHGDLLSILVAAAFGSPLREHRRHAFRPGELRRLAMRVPPAS